MKRRGKNRMEEKIFEAEDYDVLKQQFQPFDLLLFRGPGIPSKIIRKFQKKILGDGSFSHIGLLISKEVLPSLEFLKEGEWYVWESTMSIPIPVVQTDNVINEITGKGKLGVQIRKLKDVVDVYTNPDQDAFVAWAPLRKDLNPWLKKDMRKTVLRNTLQVFEETKDLGYERNLIELATSIFTPVHALKFAVKEIFKSSDSSSEDSSDSDSDDLDDSYFCSELVAYIYKNIGILDDNVDPSTVVPMDFLGYDKNRTVPKCNEKEPVRIIP